MRLERDRHRFGALLPRALHDLFEHMAVGAMHAVEVPDADHVGPKSGRNIFEFVEDLH